MFRPQPSFIRITLLLLMQAVVQRHAIHVRGEWHLPYDPTSWPPNCCAYQLSGTSYNSSFPSLTLLLYPPTDPIHPNNTYYQRRWVTRGNSGQIINCAGSTMKIWQPWDDLIDQGIMPYTWFRRYESDNITQIKGPVYIERGEIWTTPAPEELSPLLGAHLVQVDLECTPKLPGPPEQKCIQLWLTDVWPSWRNHPGEGCSSSSTGSSTQQPSSSSSQHPLTSSSPTQNSHRFIESFIFMLSVLSVWWKSFI